MKLVKESLNEFKQHGDPYEKMYLGKNRFIKKIINELKSDIESDIIKDEYLERLPNGKYFGFYFRDPINGLERPSQVYIKKNMLNKIKDLSLYWNDKIWVAAFYGDGIDLEKYFFGDIRLNISKLSDELFDLLSNNKILQDFLNK